MRKIPFCAFFILSFFSQKMNAQIEAQPVTKLSKNVEGEKLVYPLLVNKFYLLRNNNFFWMLPGEKNELMRKQLQQSIDTAFYFGLIEKKYHLNELNALDNFASADSLQFIKAERMYTDAAIAMSKNLYQGYKVQPWVGYDQLSDKYEDADNSFLLSQLLQVTTGVQLKNYFEKLEPAGIEYRALKEAYRIQKQKNSADTVAMLFTSMNYYRWIHHFQFEKLIIINLPAAWLQYYERDSLVLQMKTVVGKTSTPTPRFATVTDQIILYPYWYVPRSITFNEYLPLIKKNPSWIDAKNMQVIDGSGKIMNHLAMDWASFHNGYFPYTIRQSTGCDNALGVLKFNIISPYGVYLHDTNNQTAFLSGLRFYSHGCIRMQEPLALGNRLLAGKLDTAFLKSCYKEQKPKFIFLEKPVPVFSVYMRAVTDPFGKVTYYKDVYKLMNQ